MEKVLITGGSGFIGTQLTLLLKQNGYHVEHIGRMRNSKTGVKTWLWDTRKNYVEPGAFNRENFSALYLIHLAGEGIADKKWTDTRKNSIVESRTKTIELLYREFENRYAWPDAVISAGGTGYYGARTLEYIFNEDDAHYPDFMGECCFKWENAVNAFAAHCRTVILRTPLVLDKNEGGLPKLAGPARFGFGAALAPGRQWVPWVHAHDICQAYMHALKQPQARGVYNVVAPMHITNRQLIKAISKALRTPYFMPNVPRFALKLFLGEMHVMVTEGSRVDGSAFENTGFTYDFKELSPALKDIFG